MSRVWAYLTRSLMLPVIPRTFTSANSNTQNFNRVYINIDRKLQTESKDMIYIITCQRYHRNMYVNKPHPRRHILWQIQISFHLLAPNARAHQIHRNSRARISARARVKILIFRIFYREEYIGTDKFNTQPNAYICIHIIHNNNKHPVACCADDDDAVLIYDF